MYLKFKCCCVGKASSINSSQLVVTPSFLSCKFATFLLKSFHIKRRNIVIKRKTKEVYDLSSSSNVLPYMVKNSVAASFFVSVIVDFFLVSIIDFPWCLQVFVNLESIPEPVFRDESVKCAFIGLMRDLRGITMASHRFIGLLLFI